MRILRNLYLFALSFIIFPLSAQQDSLGIFNAKSELLRYRQPAQAAALARRVLSLSKNKPPGDPVRLQAWINLSFAIAEEGRLDSAAIAYDTVRFYALRRSEAWLQTEYHLLAGNLSDIREQYDSSLQHYFLALKNCRDPKKKASICNSIGVVYRYIKEPDNAERYFRQSLEIGMELRDSSRLQKAYNNLGGVFFARRKWEQAFTHYEAGFRIACARKDTAAMASCMNNMALVYEERGELDKALAAHGQIVQMAEGSGRRTDVITSLINAGNILMKQKKLPAAERYFSQALDAAKKDGFRILARQVQVSLAELYGQQGDYPKAIAAWKQYIAYNDSIISEQARRNASDMEARYQLKAKEQEVLLARGQKKAEELERLNAEQALSRQKEMTWLSIALGLAVLAAAVLFLLRSRAQKRYNRRLNELLNDKDVLLREIHHRVKNNLQMMSSLLSLQAGHAGGQDIKTLLDQSQSRIRAMSLLHEKLYETDQLHAISLQDYTAELLAQLSQAYSRRPACVVIEQQVAALRLDIDQLIPYGLIVNEVVTNSYKYAFPGDRMGSIRIKVEAEAELITLTIADNGAGVSEGKEGLGMKLIRGLARQLRGEISWSSSAGEGTRFVMKFQRQRLSPGNPAAA